MRKQICFNQNWLFAARELDLDAPNGQFEPVNLPHTNQEFSHQNFDNQQYQFVSTYRKRFVVDQNDPETITLVDFEGVMLACKVYLNGVFLIEHKGGFTPFSVDLSKVLETGENILTVVVDSRERKDIPPYGHVVDYLTFGGIYRDVNLRVVPTLHIKDVFVKTTNVLDDPQLTCDVTLNQNADEVTLEAVVTDLKGNRVASTQTPITGNFGTLKFEDLKEIELWSVERPALYTITVSLLEGEQPIDALSERFGFREVEFRTDGGFYLNGEKIKLFGLNRHQTYPNIGAAAPKRLQLLDADILKDELGCNIVRTSHYPQSPHFLDRCDEIGLLVFEEISGWQHIGDEDWQQISLDELKAMITRDRNHPSIILWGVRVNESGDNDTFYRKTNNQAHRLDTTRQTGGVRDFLGSSFLEDVYTYNDFSYDLREPTNKPHLITEFAGHMFPTKPWDNEDRLIKHALWHTHKHNLQMADERVAGAIGWCAFDYATHMEFGSGDRVCYHGVMDIFRLPKWAAYFYQSQQATSKRIVLKAATHWTMGDRSEGGSSPLTVFSNCDEVEVIIGEFNLGRYLPNYEQYPALSHPPFTIDIPQKYTAWGGAAFHDLLLVGYVDEKPVAEQRISANRLPAKLELHTDTDYLLADGADMTRLIFRITDPYGNPVPYSNSVVSFEIEGPADLIGTNPFPLMSGQAALFIKAQQAEGIVQVRAYCEGLPEASLQLEILPTRT